jgi:hypothetical protein
LFLSLWMRKFRKAFISRHGTFGLAARNSGPIFLDASPMISRFRQTALSRMENRDAALLAQPAALNQFLTAIPDVEKV